MPRFKRLHAVDLQCEFYQYVETALWSETAEDGEPLEDLFKRGDMPAATQRKMLHELASFIRYADDAALEFWQSELGHGRVGHDFWLTRNGHGAGFWDRFMVGVGATYGRSLTEAAKTFGESNLYVGDDGKVYVT